MITAPQGNLVPVKPNTCKKIICKPMACVILTFIVFFKDNGFKIFS